MAQYFYQLLPSTNDPPSSQPDSPNPGQATPQVSTSDFNRLFMRIPSFDTSSNEVRNLILESAGRRDNNEPILIKICSDLNRQNYAIYGRFLKALLESEHGTWIPSPNLSHTANPISLSLKTAKVIPRAIEIPRIIIDYCIRMAKQKKKFLYVSPVLGSLHELVELKELHTNLVLDTLRRLAFIPIEEEPNPTQVIVAHPLRFPWKSDTRSVDECYELENLVFQVDDLPSGEHGDSTRTNQENHNFSRDIFAASFDMLWHVSGTQKNDCTSPQSWLHAVFYGILFKCGARSKVKVECHTFNLEMLDNPAIKALLEYKWNTIGHAYWLIRFYFECLFYILVLAVVIVQVYGRIPRVSLFGAYIAIIMMASIFLVFEYLQLRRNPRRYLTSPHNIIEVAVFALPLVGSIIQILNIVNMNEKGNISVLSFSVLVIFLHCLFELRVKKDICYFVTAILEIIGRIRLFFLLFALGIVAFALTILHMLRGCPISDCGGLEDAKFSKAPFRAISTTFLFMTGFWGSVGASLELEGRNWDFDLIMVFYVIMIVMISFNILIALMNDGFQHAKDTSTAAWIQFKLKYVEEAESITYNIPGFRRNNWRFPEVVYFTATLQQQENYEKFFHKEDMEKRFESLSEDVADLKHMLSQVLATSATS